jgi:hypothetical protein
MLRIKKEQAEVCTYKRLQFFCQGYLDLHTGKSKVVSNQLELKGFVINLKFQISSTKFQLNLSASGGSIFNDQNISQNFIAPRRKIW